MAETTNPPPSTVPKHEPQDRLSTLPDTLLIDILSRLPITTAATTSVMSHHFRHLWKSTTHLTLITSSPNFTSILNHQIIPHLTSPKLHHLTLHLSSPPDLHVIDSSFRAMLNSIIIEKVTIDVTCSFYEEEFWAPKCLLTSQSLNSLELRGKVKFDLDLSEAMDLVDLPRLKRLKIDFLLDVPIWLGFLVRSCTELDLAVNLDFVESEIAECIDLTCPNLKRLRIDLVAVNKVKRTLITVYAPEMEKIVIKDCNSCYCFASDPSGLVDACVDLRTGDVDNEEFEDDDDELDGGGFDGDDDGYLRRMCKFVLGMSSVTRLEIKVGSCTNVFSYLGCVDDDGFVGMFRNLVRFEATLDGVGPIGWEGLLLSMQRFPNLRHLKVNMEGDPATENYDWCPPHIDFVPDCLTYKLKTIQICGLDGIYDDLRLAAFVLNCARILEELRLDVFIKGEYDKILGMECEFCQSLFKFPRRSSACEVVFSGRGVTTSSNTFNIEQFKGQMLSDA